MKNKFLFILVLDDRRKRKACTLIDVSTKIDINKTWIPKAENLF